MKKRLSKRFKTVPNSIYAYACSEKCSNECSISCSAGQVGSVTGTKTTSSLYAK